MTAAAPPPRRDIAGLVICAALILVFGWGLAEATGWSLRAALYPRLVSTAGLVLTLVQLVVGLRARRAPAQAQDLEEETQRAPAGRQLAGVTVLDDEEAAEQDVEYVFANAGPKAWRETLLWVALFFVGLFVFGLYVVVPLFCLAYLRLVARSSWLVAAVYAAVALVALYVPLTYLLRVPVPEGLFG